VKGESIRGVSSEEGRRCMDNFPLNRGNGDVVEVAVRKRNGGGIIAEMLLAKLKAEEVM
jgi:hypothetical protein